MSRITQCALWGFEGLKILNYILISTLILAAAPAPCVEINPKIHLNDPAEGPDSGEPLAPRSRAEIVDEALADAVPLPTGVPRVAVASDGEVFPGCWLKLTGRVTEPGGAAVTALEWNQKAGPKISAPPAELKRAELWIFLIAPGNYVFAFRAKNDRGWSKPVEVRLAINRGRAYLNEQDGSQLAGSGERIVLPGAGWKQVSGPRALLRPADNGAAFRPNDAGLYIFEAPRLEGIPERRGIRVPPAADGILGDRRPIARLIKNITGVANSPIELDGSLSMDPDPDDTEKLRAKWSTPDAARGAEIQSRPGLAAAFTARKPGAYSVTLIVSDGSLDSTPETAFIDITPARGGTESATGATDDPANLTDGLESAADIKRDPRLRRVSLAIWPLEPLADGTTFIPEDAGLERAIQMFPRRCGIDLLVDPAVARPGQFRDFPLAISAENSPLRHLIDGIARQTATRYRLEENRGIWLMPAASFFTQDKLVPFAVGVDALHDSDDGADLLRPLREYFKPAMEGREGAALNYEKAHQELVGTLPLNAALRLKEIASVLREPSGLGLQASPPLSKDELRLRAWLADKTVTARGRFRLDRLLRDISENTGVALNFDPRDFPRRNAPFVTVNFSATPLRQALRDLAELAGFSGVSIEAPSGAWFFKGPRPYPGAELFCESAIVRAFDLAAIYDVLTPEAAALLSGETIAFAVRSKVFPASWNEAGTLIFYHNTTRKLLVVHSPLAQRKVLEALNDLRERGEWALGPSQ